MSELSIAESIRQDYEEEIERLTISLQAQEELTISWYNKTKQQDKEIERLNNIIKEVREYIKSMKIWDIEQEEDMKKLLEILDKGE